MPVTQQTAVIGGDTVQTSQMTGFSDADIFNALTAAKNIDYVTPRNTAELVAAINAEQNINLAGDTFTFTQGYAFQNKSVMIRGRANFVTDYSVNPQGFIPLEFEYGFTDSVSVTSISDVEFDFGGGLTKVTRLQVSSASSFSAGNVVKVISTDQIAWLDPLDNQKMGSSHTVGAVDAVNNYIYLLDVVYHAFSTSIKIAKYNQAKSADINAEIKWSKSGTHTGNIRRSTLHIKGAFKPIVKGMKGHELYGEFISFTGCYHPLTKGNFAESLITDSAKDQYGYVVVERSCSYGEHLKNSGNNVRHVYTNGACFNPSAEDFAAYGCNEYSEVSGSRGFQCSSSVDDTHPGSYRCSLKDTQVYYPQRGHDGALWSVQVRGVEDSVISPVIHGGDAIVVRKEFAHSKLTSGITVLNPIYHSKPGESIIAPFRVEGLPGSRILNLKIKGAIINDCQPLALLKAEYAEIIFEEDVCYCRLNESGSVGPFDLNDSKVTIIGGRVDLTGSTASNIRHSLMADANSEIVCKGFHELVAGGSSWAALVDFKGAAGKAYYYDFQCDTVPSFPTPWANRVGSSVLRWGYQVNNGLVSGPNVLSISKSANFSLNGNRIEELTHKNVLVEINLSTAAGLTQLTAVPSGDIKGQTLTIANHPDSVNTLQINGGGNFARSGNLQLLPGESKTFNLSPSGKWSG